MSVVQSWIALTFAPGLGLSTFWRLVDHFGSPELVFASSPDQLLKVRGVKEVQVTSLLARDELMSAAESEIASLQKLGAQAVIYSDPLYPKALKDLSDPPPVLYTLGDIKVLQDPMVAIVGSRAATVYGRRIARRLAGELAANGIVVTSGLALGIDAEAHIGALEAQGATIGVLGCGLNFVYPRQNEKLFRQIAKTGLIVTEYPLGTKPEPFRFPARNRIIAGLAAGVVVVEATRKSGSLITAQIGLDLNRDIFAVPGQVDSLKSEGTHWLLQQGAKLVSCATDIVSELEGGCFRSRPFPRPETDKAGDSELAGDDSLAGDVLQLLDSYPQSRDDLQINLDVSAARLSEVLLLLELDGKIEMHPGNLVSRVV